MIRQPAPEKIISSLRVSIVEGAFANVFATLTGNVFLPAYALLLGASSLQIGFLASVPFFANLAQLGGSYLVERFNRRKRLAILFGFWARLLWAPFVLASLALADRDPQRLLALLMVLVVVHHLLGAFGGVAWLSWMMALVPDEIRGRFFGLRNVVLGATAIVFTLLGGRFLDWLPQTLPDLSPTRSFEALFLVAVVGGLASIGFARRVIEPCSPTLPEKNARDLYSAPLKRPDFRGLLRFAVLWSFAVNIASPFFLVYMLKDLGLDYTSVAGLVVASAVADLLGMWCWGHISDHIGNKPVVMLAASMAALVPLLWLLTAANPVSFYLLIPLLHLFAGFFWAGYNLSSANLVFRLVPREGNAVFFAYWSAFNGVAAGVGALIGGWLARELPAIASHLPALLASEFKLIFLLSAVLRLTALPLLRHVHEPKGLPLMRAVRVLRNVRSWATVMGFHPALHFFVSTKTAARESSPYWPLWRRHRVSQEDSAAAVLPSTPSQNQEDGPAEEGSRQ